MKKLLIILPLVFLLTGCSSSLQYYKYKIVCSEYSIKWLTRQSNIFDAWTIVTDDAKDERRDCIIDYVELFTWDKLQFE